MFKQVDVDGSGELNFAEFKKAVRQEIQIPEKQISTQDLKKLFCAVDADGSGAVSAAELSHWVWNGSGQGGKRKKKVKSRGGLKG